MRNFDKIVGGCSRESPSLRKSISFHVLPGQDSMSWNNRTVRLQQIGEVRETGADTGLAHAVCPDGHALMLGLINVNM